MGGVWDAQGDRQVASDFGGGTNTFTNSGTLRNTGSLGTLTVGGGAIGFTSTGIIERRIGGTGAGQYDVLAVVGQAGLGGTLDVQLVNGFVPAVSHEFTLLTFGSRIGTFGAVNGNGHTYASCYSTTSVKLGDPANPLFCGGT